MSDKMDTSGTDCGHVRNVSATERLRELRDLAADVNPSEIIDHVSITRMGWTFDAQWLDAWHAEFDRVMQAIAATLGGGKLTAEQVGEAIKRNFVKVAVIDDGREEVEWREEWVCNVGFNFQAIADELNAKLGGGECEIECFDDGVDESMDGEWVSYAPPTWYLSCGHEVQGIERPNYCIVCGKRCVHHG